MPFSCIKSKYLRYRVIIFFFYINRGLTGGEAVRPSNVDHIKHLYKKDGDKYSLHNVHVLLTDSTGNPRDVSFQSLGRIPYK